MLQKWENKVKPKEMVQQTHQIKSLINFKHAEF